MSTPAGWYPNPEDATQQRYWDGVAWTSHTAPAAGYEPTLEIPATPVSPPPPPPPPPAPPVPLATAPHGGPPHGIEPWYRKKWVWITAAIFVVIAGIGALGGGNDDTTPVADKPAAVTTVTETPELVAPTATVTVESEPEQPAGESNDESQVGNNAAAQGETFIVPNQVGKNLQAAQDDLQAITGNPLYFSDSEDATGAGRFQAWDSNWKVCSQNIKPGTRLPVSNMDIVFAVVKTDETCP